MAKVSTKMLNTLYEAGYLDVPQKLIDSDYTPILTDRGVSLDYNGAGSHTISIPTNAAVAFPIGSVLSITNISANTITVAPNATVTLYKAGTTETANKTLAANAVTTLRKIGTNTWIIGGAGVT